IPGFESTSEWSQMVNRTFIIIRFVFKALKYSKEATVQHALAFLFKRIQAICTSSLKTEVGKLPVYEDDKGILRVRTRNSEDRPIWIPKGSRIAIMLVRHCHLRARHMRRRFTKALINEKYYIQGVNRLIDRVL